MKKINSLLVGLSLVIASLAVLEGLSWIGGRVDLPGPLISASKPWGFNRAFDPLLFWRMRSGSDPEINSLGFRGPEIGEKAQGEFRILSLGESTTFGVRVPYTDCYSAIVGAELELRGWNRIRVINAGVPGYTLFQGYQYLKHRGMDLHPDGVLLYFGYNDFLPVAFRAQRDAALDSETTGLTDRALYEQRRRLSFRTAALVLQHSNLFRRLFFRRHRGLTVDQVRIDRSKVRVPEEDRRALLADFQSFSNEHSLKLAIIVPWYQRFEEHIPLLREFGRSTGIPIVDLPARLEDLPGNKSEYFHDRVHPNSAGHRLMATAIIEELSAAWN